ncbi:MAG: hypothetical protein KF819_08465 [Labilithrix sp.]|nr:hypothetical protein [Labilithrix sp.]
MRSQKFLFVSAAVAASLTVAKMSLADEPTETTQGATQGSQTTTQVTRPPSQPPPMTPGVPVTPPVSTTTITAGELTAVTSHADKVTIYGKRRPNTPLLVTGVSMFLGSYATTAAVAGIGGRAADENLFIPVVGPWLNVADRRCERCAGEDLNKVLVVGSGIIQGLGVLMAGASFLVPEKFEAATIQAGPMKLQIAPTAAQGGAGIGAFGTF